MYNFFVITFLALTASFMLPTLGDTPYDCPSCVKTRVGRAEYVYGPSYAPMDNTYFSLNTDGLVKGYSANGNTEIIATGPMDSQTQANTIVLDIGGSDDFDSCGAWLNSVIVDGDVIRGWYHAETQCDYSNNGQTYKSVGYAESYDGGLTFVKPNYPNNQVIAGSLPPTEATCVGNADQSVVDGGDGYYYMFFINWDDYANCVARAPQSTGGVPGSWMKYYNGDWTQPGLGGLCSGIPYIRGVTMYNHESGNYIGIGYGEGINVFWGEDPLTWVTMEEPIFYNEPLEWTRTSTSTELIAYPSFVAEDGGQDDLGWTFYLYYVYLQPGEDFLYRYQIRRQVTITMGDTADTAPQSGVELSTYTAGTRSWTTTTAPLDDDYTYEGSMGYILTTDYDNTRPIYDCYIPLWDDHVLTINSGDCVAANGINYLRKLGWVYSSDQTSGGVVATQPLYRCFNALTLKHSVSQNIDCDLNGIVEYVLGYAMTA